MSPPCTTSQTISVQHHEHAVHLIHSAYTTKDMIRNAIAKTVFNQHS